jgi:hypothetical protein
MVAAWVLRRRSAVLLERSVRRVAEEARAKSEKVRQQAKEDKASTEPRLAHAKPQEPGKTNGSTSALRYLTFPHHDPAHRSAADALDAGELPPSLAGRRSHVAHAFERTRQRGDLPTILDALAAAVSARDACEDAMALPFERLLAVQMETVLRREHISTGHLSLDTIGRAVHDAIAAGSLSPGVRSLFATLRQRVAAGSGTRRRDDPALERLVQRIRVLRAKTVAQGCTEEEALAAAEKVAELLDRHSLSLGELDFRAQPCDGLGIQTNRRRFAPIDICSWDRRILRLPCLGRAIKGQGPALRVLWFARRCGGGAVPL